MNQQKVRLLRLNRESTHDTCGTLARGQYRKIVYGHPCRLGDTTGTVDSSGAATGNVGAARAIVTIGVEFIFQGAASRRDALKSPCMPKTRQGVT